MQFEMTKSEQDSDGRPRKPTRDEYEGWLAAVWKGDQRELRKGRYLQQQRDLRQAFLLSSFSERMKEELRGWATEYYDSRKVYLFTGAIPDLTLALKPWDSFLSRTWRVNVHNNANWPDPPAEGWLSPDCWFEGLWDIVRGRIVVRYLDGVQFLADRMSGLARELGVPVSVKTHAQEVGYYAMHLTVRQPFQVQTLNFEDWEMRESGIEIQLTTELQETIGMLTHRYFEKRREETLDPEEKWQWNYKSPEFTPYYLGHMLHYLEGMIMRVRDEMGGADSV